MTDKTVLIGYNNANTAFEELTKLLKEGQEAQIFVTKQFMKELKVCSGVKNPKRGGLPPYGEIDIEWLEFIHGKDNYQAAFVFFCDGEQDGYLRLVYFKSNAVSYYASMSRMDRIVFIKAAS